MDKKIMKIVVFQLLILIFPNNCIISTKNTLIDLMELITYQNELYQFDTFIVFNDKMDINYAEDLLKFLQFKLNKPIILLKKSEGASSTKKIVDKFNSNALSIVSVESVEDDVLKFVNSSLTHMHFSKMILIVENDLQMNEIVGIFEWCWRERFVNVVVYLIWSEEIFGYTPFPILQVYNVTGSMDLFPNKMRDVKGFVLRSPVKQDPPRSFSYTNKKGQKAMSGHTANMFIHYLRFINAKFEEIKLKNSLEYVNILEIIKMIYRNEVEISFHATAGSHLTNISYVYPYGKSLWCIILPYAKEIPRSTYFLLPFQLEVWIVLCILSGYIIFVKRIETSLTRTKFDFGLTLLNSILKILYLPSNTKVELKWRTFLFQGLDFLLGFITSNFYLAFLSCFLAAVKFEPLIKTWKDLENSNFKIMAVDYEIDSFYELDPDFPAFLRKKFNIVARDVFGKHRSALNTSFAYTCSTQAAFYLLAQQKTSPRPLFQKPDFCLTDDLLSFPIRQDSPFMETFKRYMMVLQEVGLDTYWQLKSNDDGFRAGFLKKFNVETVHKHILVLSHFTAAWYTIGFGSILGIVTFLGEFVRFSCRNIKRKNYK